MLDPAATGSMVEVEPRYQGPAGPGAPDLGLSNDTNPAIDAVPPLEKPGLIRVNTWERPLTPSARSIPMLNNAPWVRSLGAIDFSIQTQGWRFPLPPDLNLRKSRQACPASNTEEVEPAPDEPEAQPTQEMIDFATAAGENPVVGTQEAVLGLPVGGTALLPPGAEGGEGVDVGDTITRLKPPATMAGLKDRLLTLLQPPLEGMLGKGRLTLPFKPYPYQLQGIAFLMPRSAALIADEMGLGKTVQVILSLRLLISSGMLKRALVVCPKPLVINWTRELRTWAPDLAFEVFSGDTETRTAMWKVSNCPVQVVNYEILTRDHEVILDPDVKFDVVVLDEAQRIKNAGGKTAQAAKALKRSRSWAMSGTPIENRVEDLTSIFSFVDPKLIPPDAHPRQMSEIVRDHIIRRTKDLVATHMPPRVIRDIHLELSPEQRETYDKAEKEGIVHLNSLGDTITVQHVFQLVMRLKQICNFDPRTGASAKMEQLTADMEEVASTNNKAILFSQWVEPLESIAAALAEYNPVQYHGKIPQPERQPILDKFKADPIHKIILMSYGTGSVGLNLQYTNYVFLFDRWWNPAIEDQAINRAHRLGQKSTVFVSRYISVNTIEERIALVLDQKRALFQEVIAQNGPPISMGLSEDEIFGLFDIHKTKKAA
jgi:superfamily II DNA or RNA helicase